MAISREREVTRAFVAIASSFANGYDVIDLLTTLTADTSRLLDVESAGLLLADDRRVLHVVAASNENTRQLELFQLQREQGPCLDCYHEGAAIAVPDLQQSLSRWPQFVPAARAAGFASVHALPMRLRETVLGTLGLFGNSIGSLNDEDLTLGQALADAASAALVQDRAASDSTAVNEQLQTALTSRVVIEQAKGVIAQHGNLDMNQAFAVLRRYSRDKNLKLSATASAVVSRTLNASQIVAHARSTGMLQSRA